MSTPTFPDASLSLSPDAQQRMAAEFETPRRSSEHPSDAAVTRWAKWMMPRGTVLPARIAATDLARPLARRRIEQVLQAGGPRRLHIGSGSSYKPGWTNIDLLPVKVDVPWNLARGIPFPDASVDAVFHEHLQEHLTLGQGFALARESLRVLRPGGVLRIGVPDAGQALQSYAGNWDDDWARSAATPMIAVQRLFYEHQHRAMYDGQTLKLMLEVAGFVDVTRCAFGEGRAADADSPARAAGTLYVEGLRP